GGFDAATLQGQSGELAAGKGSALIGRGQQTNVAEWQYGNVRLKFTELEFGFGNPRLQGKPHATVIVRRRSAVFDRQQPCPYPTGTTVELEAEGSNTIDTKTDRAWGIAGFEVENEALRPFFGLGFFSAPNIQIVALKVVVPGL